MLPYLEVLPAHIESPFELRDILELFLIDLSVVLEQRDEGFLDCAGYLKIDEGFLEVLLFDLALHREDESFIESLDAVVEPEVDRDNLLGYDVRVEGLEFSENLVTQESAELVAFEGVVNASQGIEVPPLPLEGYTVLLVELADAVLVLFEDLLYHSQPPLRIALQVAVATPQTVKYVSQLRAIRWFKFLSDFKFLLVIFGERVRRKIVRLDKIDLPPVFFDYFQ